MRSLELLQQRLGDASGRKGAAHPFERGHDLEALDDVPEAERSNESAPSRMQLHQPGRGQLH